MKKKFLGIFLAVMMLIGMLPTGVLAADSTESSSFMRIFHLDCGRKYFSVSQIEGIIDKLSENHYNYMELAVGNNGLRFLLDDMSVGSYSSSSVTSAITSGNASYNSSDALSQSEMDTIIAYAAEKNIEIIPLINMPGHATAIVSAMRTLGLRSSTGTDIDVTSSTQTAFAEGLLSKYVDYFKGKGCSYFNFGADEYSSLSSSNYTKFATYYNEAASIIEDAGMIPMSFNDCVNRTNLTTSTAFDTNVIICYWSGGTNYATIKQLSNAGFRLLNFNCDWYYVLGDALYDYWSQGQWGYSDSKSALQSKPVTQFVDGTTADTVTPLGSCLCVWCDYPSYSYSSDVQSKVYDLIETMASSNPTYFTADSESGDSGSGTTDPDSGTTDPDSGTTDPDSGTTDPDSGLSQQTVDLTQGESVTLTDESGDYTSDYTGEGLDSSIASVSVSSINTGETASYTKASAIESGEKYIIANSAGKVVETAAATSSSWSSVSGLGVYSGTISGSEITGSSLDSYVWTFTQSGSGYTIQSADGTYMNFSGTSGNNSVTLSSTAKVLNVDANGTGFVINNGSVSLNNFGGANSLIAAYTTESSSNDTWYLYKQNQEKETQITITANAAGSTSVQVGSTVYTINVTAASVPEGQKTLSYSWTGAPYDEELPESQSYNAGEVAEVDTDYAAGLTYRVEDQLYTFSGWFTDEALTVPAEDTLIMNEDTTLYGEWTCEEIPKATLYYSWTGAPEAATLPESKSCEIDSYVKVDTTYTEGSTISDDTAVYTFSGWYTDEAMTVKAEKYVLFEAGTVLYGEWTSEPIQVSAEVTVDTDDTSAPFLTVVTSGSRFSTKTFTYTLTAIEGAPVDKTSASVYVSKAGTKYIDFGDITYTEEGTYYYNIAQTTRNGSGWTCDTTTKRITVVVTKGSDGQLTASVTGGTVKNTYRSSGIWGRFW